MGFKISWLAVENAEAADVLPVLELRPTGEQDEVADAPLNGCRWPNGWYIVVTDFDEDKIFPRDVLAHLSRSRQLIRCNVHEGVMFSSAEAWSNGERRWRVDHQGDDRPVVAKAEGILPPQYASIRDKMAAQQAAEDAGPAEVDWLFEVPLALAASICGYKHDEGHADEPAYDILEPIERKLTAASDKPGLFRRIFG